MPPPEQASPGNSRFGRAGRLMAALAAGMVGGLIAPLFYPALARSARPAAKRVLKGGIAAFERGRVAAAELGEQASDLFAEARAEYEDERQPTGAGEPASAREIVPLHGAAREATRS